jgi:ABC-type transporter Mla subunit MlaD
MTPEQKARMKLNGTPDAARDNSPAIQQLTSELDALVAQMEADSKQHAQETENLADAMSELGGNR